MNVPRPVTDALSRLLAATLDRPARLDVVVIAPAGSGPGPAGNGPVDAVRDHGVGRLNLDGTTVTLHMLSAQHTRCWLLSCDLPGLTVADGIERLPPVISDTSRLSEYMHDRGLGDDWPQLAMFESADRVLVAFTGGHGVDRYELPYAPSVQGIPVAVLGTGVIGKRIIHELAADDRFDLTGIIVRSANVFVHARPELPYYSFDEDAAQALRESSIKARGSFRDALGQAEVIIDCGPSRTGATRAASYRAAGVRSVFCGGERDSALGPLVHPELSPKKALTAHSVRLTSCNTTALARVVAAVGPENIAELDATVVRCCTDRDKANKGITNGAVLGPVPSHHASDLASVVPGLRARSMAMTVPMNVGHVIHARLALLSHMPRAMAVSRLAGGVRLNLLPAAEIIDQMGRRAAMTTPWRNRYALDVQVVDTDVPDRLDLWLALDNEAITIPEALDVLATTD
jgi:glyceraldehyde-3-phosphate dehydrogenase (NAD(P))